MSQSDTQSARSDPAPTRRRRLPPAERRASILEAALPCFAQRGYMGAGTRDLARAAGVTEPILYRHFGGKADLFGAVLERAADRLAELVTDATAGQASADARLAALAAALPGIIQECGPELRILNAGALASGEADIRRATAAAIERLGRLLSESFEGVELRPGVSAEAAGFLLMEIGLGASMMRPLGVREVEAESYGEQAVEILLHGLAEVR